MNKFRDYFQEVFQVNIANSLVSFYYKFSAYLKYQFFLYDGSITLEAILSIIFAEYVTLGNIARDLCMYGKNISAWYVMSAMLETVLKLYPRSENILPLLGIFVAIATVVKVNFVYRQVVQ